MGPYRRGIFLCRWFEIGSVAGCVLTNLLLDGGYADAVRAVRVIMKAVHVFALLFCRFPAAAVGIVPAAAVCLLYLRHTRRVWLWMMLIMLAAGGIYAGAAAMIVRGMMEMKMV